MPKVHAHDPPAARAPPRARWGATRGFLPFHALTTRTTHTPHAHTHPAHDPARLQHAHHRARVGAQRGVALPAKLDDVSDGCGDTRRDRGPVAVGHLRGGGGGGGRWVGEGGDALLASHPSSPYPPTHPPTHIPSQAGRQANHPNTSPHPHTHLVGVDLEVIWGTVEDDLHAGHGAHEEVVPAAAAAAAAGATGRGGGGGG